MYPYKGQAWTGPWALGRLRARVSAAGAGPRAHSRPPCKDMWFLYAYTSIDRYLHIQKYPYRLTASANYKHLCLAIVRWPGPAQKALRWPGPAQKAHRSHGAIMGTYQMIWALRRCKINGHSGRWRESVEIVGSLVISNEFGHETN